MLYAHVHIHTYANLKTTTGGVYLGFALGGATVTMSAGRASSPSLTPTNIHLVSSLHPCSETPAWPLPHFPSFCLFVSHLHFDLRRDELSLPAGKWASVVWTWGAGGGRRGQWEILRGILCQRLLQVLLGYCVKILVPVVVIFMLWILTEGSCFHRLKKIFILYQFIKIFWGGGFFCDLIRISSIIF